MYPGLISGFCVLALTWIPPVFTSPAFQGTILHSINIAEHEASMGLQRRGSKDLSVINPQNQTYLVYGFTQDNGEDLLANMTLHAPDGLPIVSLEHFEALNVSVNCRDGEGTLALTFGSMDAFEYAKAQWDYVNREDNGGNFLLIANHDGCGPDDRRQGYVISKITDDTSTLTTLLDAKAVAWSDVAGSYDLSWGHRTPVSQADQLKGKVGRGIMDDLTGDYARNSTTLSFGIDAGYPNQRNNVYTGDDLVLDCTSCFIAGSFEVQGQITVQDFALQDLIVTASPKSVMAALELEATVTATESPQSLSHEVTLFNAPIPGAGVKIPDIMTLGASLKYSIGVDASFSGFADLNFGVNASLPDTAHIVADYNNHGASYASGFDSVQLAPMFNLNNVSGSVTLNASSKPAITFEIELVKIGSVDVAVTVNLPEASVELSAVSDQNGACNTDEGASKTGIKLDSEASIEIDLDIDAHVSRYDAPWSTPLWSTSKPLTSACYPVSVPGLKPPAATTTSGPSIFVTPVGPANVSRVLPTPTARLGRKRRWEFNSSDVSLQAKNVTLESDPSINLSPLEEGQVVSGVLAWLGEAGKSTLVTSLMSTAIETSASVLVTTSSNLGTGLTAMSLIHSRTESSFVSVPTSSSVVETVLVISSDTRESSAKSASSIFLMFSSASSEESSSSSILSSTSLTGYGITSSSALAISTLSSNVGVSSALSSLTSTDSKETSLAIETTSSLESLLTTASAAIASSVTTRLTTTTVLSAPIERPSSMTSIDSKCTRTETASDLSTTSPTLSGTKASLVPFSLKTPTTAQTTLASVSSGESTQTAIPSTTVSKSANQLSETDATAFLSSESTSSASIAVLSTTVSKFSGVHQSAASSYAGTTTTDSLTTTKSSSAQLLSTHSPSGLSSSQNPEVDTTVVESLTTGSSLVQLSSTHSTSGPGSSIRSEKESGKFSTMRPLSTQPLSTFPSSISDSSLSFESSALIARSSTSETSVAPHTTTASSSAQDSSSSTSVDVSTVTFSSTTSLPTSTLRILPTTSDMISHTTMIETTAGSQSMAVISTTHSSGVSTSSQFTEYKSTTVSPFSPLASNTVPANTAPSSIQQSPSIYSPVDVASNIPTSTLSASTTKQLSKASASPRTTPTSPTQVPTSQPSVSAQIPPSTAPLFHPVNPQTTPTASTSTTKTQNTPSTISIPTTPSSISSSPHPPTETQSPNSQPTIPSIPSSPKKSQSPAAPPPLSTEANTPTKATQAPNTPATQPAPAHSVCPRSAKSGGGGGGGGTFHSGAGSSASSGAGSGNGGKGNSGNANNENNNNNNSNGKSNTNTNSNNNGNNNNSGNSGNDGNSNHC